MLDFCSYSLSLIYVARPPLAGYLACTSFAALCRGYMLLYRQATAETWNYPNIHLQLYNIVEFLLYSSEDREYPLGMFQLFKHFP